MQHALVGHHPAPAAQLGQAALGRVQADHHRPLGHRHEQRSGVHVAGAGAGLHLERGPARVGQVGGVAVVHDALEDGDGPDPHGIGEHATALADAVAAALPGWVERSLGRFLADPDAATVAGCRERVAAAVEPELRALLAEDVDAQRATPLQVVRAAVPILTAALRDAGAAPVARDEQDRAAFPDDAYGLTPASWADLGDDVLAAGIAWGAAKAWVVRRRHGLGR